MNRIEPNQILNRIDPEPNQNSNRTRIRSGFNSDTNSSLGSNLGLNSGSVRIRFGSVRIRFDLVRFHTIVMKFRNFHSITYIFSNKNNSPDRHFYIHHDLMLPSYPVCLEWMDFDPTENGAGKYY